MADPTDYASRLAWAMEQSGVTKTALAAALGISYQAVKKVLDGKSASFTASNNASAAKMTDVNPSWLATGKGPKRIPNAVEEPSVSVPDLPPKSKAAYKAIPTLNWGRDMELVRGEFRLTVPDDAMAPRVRAGQMIVLSAELDPRPGDGVLVQDSDGTHYFRQYQERRPGHWQAVAFNEAYQPLDSITDGLKVLAVLIAVEARWA
jgi:phage repressor protein C with HTH and peptisase S24 domain